MAVDLFFETECMRVAEIMRCRAVEAQREADRQLMATVPQKPCDIGLFGDEMDQFDLVEQVRSKAMSDDDVRFPPTPGLKQIAENVANALGLALAPVNTEWVPQYERWRHGGWYVTNIRRKGGAVGCVSRNYPDKKWRIVCDDRNTTYGMGSETDITYRTRDDAARGEREIYSSDE